MSPSVIMTLMFLETKQRMRLVTCRSTEIHSLCVISRRTNEMHRKW